MIYRFERDVVVAATLDRVFEELSEPARFLGLQPLLTEIREVPQAAGARAFEAVERVPLFGPVAIRNRLHVVLTPLAGDQRVAFATRAPLGIRITGDFSLRSAGTGTSVRESVALECPRWLRGFVLRKAIAAQEALLANLARRLDSSARERLAARPLR